MQLFRIKVWLHIIAISAVLIGAINWGIEAAVGKDLLKPLIGNKYARWVYVFVALCGIFLLFSRNTYLPFLGPTALPCSIIPDRVPKDANDEVRILAPPGSKIIYWAAEPANEGLKTIQSWREAYDKYENAGVTTVDESGLAVLKVRSPQPYAVPFKQLQPHVHYRICQNNGIIGEVRTKFIADKLIAEGFQTATDPNLAKVVLNSKSECTLANNKKTCINTINMDKYNGKNAGNKKIYQTETICDTIKDPRFPTGTPIEKKGGCKTRTIFRNLNNHDVDESAEDNNNRFCDREQAFDFNCRDSSNNNISTLFDISSGNILITRAISDPTAQFINFNPTLERKLKNIYNPIIGRTPYISGSEEVPLTDLENYKKDYDIEGVPSFEVNDGAPAIF
jgi:uncharacterized membrane protein YuzA (DUF378 family)